MEISIGFKIAFTAPAPTPIIALTSVHPSLVSNLRELEKLSIEPSTPYEDYLDAFGNHAIRFVAPAGPVILHYDNTIVAPDHAEPVVAAAIQHAVEDLPNDTLQFLLPSRYCEVDLLADTAWMLFGNTDAGWARVQAIADWVHNHITFGYEHASPTKTSREVYEDGHGVCRDFTHLAITFCRCMNIPARYATGYLGEIRIPRTAIADDFSAFLEVYLSGAWHVFDARNNVRRIGRTLMARGRDAADTAITTSFTPLDLQDFQVWSKEVER